MSLNRWAKKRDDTEPEIITSLEALGASVYPLDRPCDLLVGYGGVNYLIECKTGKRKLNKNQSDFADAWRGMPLIILRTGEEAIEWMKTVRSTK